MPKLEQKTSFRTSESLGAIAGALAAARGEMDKLLKGAENPFFKSKYADLAACLETAIPHLAKNKIACIQGSNHLESGAIEVSTRLIHSSGEWLETSVTLKPVKFDPQGIGSCITYGRRYGFAALTSIAQQDDDGNEASQPLPQNQRQQPAKKQVRAPKQAETITPKGADDVLDMSPPKKKAAAKPKAPKAPKAEEDTTPASAEIQKALAVSIAEATTEESVEMMGMIEKMKGAE